ncbi:hypothetical protein MP638_002506 [Amoeboaphelidium occidentale]|nr:hypothetical protein MP638_002506 [Amoeboaphelidium occidentale]
MTADKTLQSLINILPKKSKAESTRNEVDFVKFMPSETPMKSHNGTPHSHLFRNALSPGSFGIFTNVSNGREMPSSPSLYDLHSKGTPLDLRHERLEEEFVEQQTPTRSFQTLRDAFSEEESFEGNSSLLKDNVETSETAGQTLLFGTPTKRPESPLQIKDTLESMQISPAHNSEFLIENESPNPQNNFLKKGFFSSPLHLTGKRRVSFYEEWNSPKLKMLVSANGSANGVDSGKSSNKDYFNQNYFVEKTLGKGEFAEAFLVTRVKGEGQNSLCVIKRNKQIYHGSKDRKRKLEEVEILKELSSNDRIVKLYQAWEQRGILYMELEYCDLGNLSQYSSALSRSFTEDETLYLFTQLVQGLSFIHSKDVLHLDIKPSNILITSNGTDDPNASMPFSIKVSDFGMAVSRTSEEFLDHLSSSFTRSIIGIDREGDRVYVAKEIITESKYSVKCDIFSLGLTMLETSFNVLLPCEGSLWHTLRDQEFHIDPNQVRLMPANEKISSIISLCMNSNPVSRPSADEILCML